MASTRLKSCKGKDGFSLKVQCGIANIEIGTNHSKFS